MKPPLRALRRPRVARWNGSAGTAGPTGGLPAQWTSIDHERRRDSGWFQTSGLQFFPASGFHGDLVVAEEPSDLKLAIGVGLSVGVRPPLFLHQVNPHLPVWAQRPVLRV